MRQLQTILLLFWGTAIIAHAETISNYSDCETCPGNIHYGAGEAKQILGTQAFELVSRLSGFSGLRLKIDLDGVRPPGTGEDPDGYWELEIKASQEIFYVQDLGDKSYIQLITDFQEIKTADRFENWRPEIYLQAGYEDQIELKDSLPEAWEKLKGSGIYQWIISGDSSDSWSEALKEKICFGLMQALAYRNPS